MQTRLCSPALLKRVGFRCLSTNCNGDFPPGFTLFPSFLDTHEQRILLTAALDQLDSLESKRVRRFQKQYRILHGPSEADAFLPERLYTFQKGHYDNVIRDYREMHLSSWGESQTLDLSRVLNRLHTLYPSENTQTHILHLASEGEILPHIDNIFSSGRWILAVSLGAARVLRMEENTLTPKKFDVLLTSGSVYLQRDDVRYHWKHSLTRPHGSMNTVDGQRVSIVVRDRKEWPQIKTGSR
ncbi:hypothetical protein BKA82DRAFT_4121461 [Pisolithus tinctorius]|nr:hypothetical protein BKA82DRAFT_4121461 [Pisolithus tinctorius]